MHETPDTTDRHGGPRNRGSADAYYGRPRNPHKYSGPTGHSPPVTLTDPEEIATYNQGFDAQDDRKEWD